MNFIERIRRGQTRAAASCQIVKELTLCIYEYVYTAYTLYSTLYIYVCETKLCTRAATLSSLMMTSMAALGVRVCPLQCECVRLWVCECVQLCVCVCVNTKYSHSISYSAAAFAVADCCRNAVCTLQQFDLTYPVGNISWVYSA